MYFVDGVLELSPKNLNKILELSLSRGGEFSEIYLEHKISRSVEMDGGEIGYIVENFNDGACIRLLSGENTGYCYTNNLSFEKLKEAAHKVSSIANTFKPNIAQNITHREIQRNTYPVSSHTFQKSLKREIELLKETIAAANNFNSKIKLVAASFLNQVRQISIINSEGLFVTDVQPFCHLGCSVIAEKENKREVGYSGRGAAAFLEYFSNKFNPEDIGKESAWEALKSFEAVDAPSGEMTFIVAPGYGGLLIHEAIGHLLEADINRKEASIFDIKSRERICNEQVNIYDDPTIPYFQGSYRFDDEGIKPQKTLLVERGYINAMLLDRLSAKLMNMSSTGHGRRQDFMCIPIPRMSNTFIDAGEYSPKEIINSVRRGFYAEKVQGGQIDDAGNIIFSVKSGYLIEDGKITAPTKQTVITGNNVDIVNGINMVGSDLDFDHQIGKCKKKGQNVRVTYGSPTIKIDKVFLGRQK